MTDELIELLRGYRRHRIAVTALVAAITCDLPDGRERVEAAIGAASEMAAAAKGAAGRERRADAHRVGELGRDVLALLDSGVKQGLEWPVTE